MELLRRSPFDRALRTKTTTQIIEETTEGNKIINQDMGTAAEVIPEVKETMVRKKFQGALICNNVEVPVLMNLEDLTQVHPAIKGMFHNGNIPNVPLAGRLKHFLLQWQKLTRDPQILSIVEGIKIPFLSKPFQGKPPHQIHFSSDQKSLVHLELQAMMQKGAISPTSHSLDQFVSNIFLVPKKDGDRVVGQRPVINLKDLNHFIPCEHF